MLPRAPVRCVWPTPHMDFSVRDGTALITEEPETSGLLLTLRHFVQHGGEVWVRQAEPGRAAGISTRSGLRNHTSRKSSELLLTHL